MSKQRRKQRGLRAEVFTSMRDHSTRFRMIVDEVLDHNRPDQIKLRNGGGHQYQRRHLELITYRVQAFHNDPYIWGRDTYYRRQYEHRPYGDIHLGYYKDGNDTIRDIRDWTYSNLLSSLDNPSRDETPVMFGDYTDGSAYKVVEPFYVSDEIPAYRDQLTSAVLSTKHHPPTTPKADIKWPGSESDFFMEALGHYTQTRLSYPQLTLADMANGIYTKVMEHSDTIMGRVSMQARSSGKSMSINRTFMDAYYTRRWFDENMKFKLLPHQRTVVEQLRKLP